MSSVGNPIAFTTSITADPKNNLETSWNITDESVGVGNNYRFWNPAI